MKKSLCGLLIISSVMLTISLTGCSSSRITVINTGNDDIGIKSDTCDGELFLGRGGTGYFNRDSVIQIGNARITLGRRIKIANTGSEIIQITYNGEENKERKIGLGQNAVGYVGKAKKFKVNDVEIQINWI